MPDISIVIVTRNRVEALIQTLNTLLQLPEQPPIFVVDNQSTDDTVVRVRRLFPEVTLLALPENCGAAARNRGVAATQTPFVAFCDDDSYWAPRALTKAVAYFEAYPRVALLAGKVLVGPEHTLDPVCEALASSPLAPLVRMPGPAILGFLACGAIIRKTAFEAVGGFEQCFGIGGEEELLAVDLVTKGWGLTYVDDLIGYHFPAESRNPDRRMQVQTRNTLWFYSLRRPWPRVAGQWLRTGLHAVADANARKGWLEAFKGIPEIWAQRRVVPSGIEEQIRLLN